VGRTVKDVQDEFGGAGNFYIPVESHYLLEDESWNFDRWPEFYNGKNVADFYDPDIEEKLRALEEEEDKLLQMERDENDLMESEEEEEGLTSGDMKRSLKEVRGKKTILKMQHKLKRNLRAKSKNRDLADMEAHLESKGISVNKESLRNRIKSRKTLGDLEGNLDKGAKKALPESDEEIKEGDRVGRKRKRSYSPDDGYMEVDQGNKTKKSTDNKSARTVKDYNPKQLKIRSQSRLRSMSQSRREGSVPQRHPTRMVSEESVRLAKKINKRFKHSININEADRVVTTAKPRHLYSGKRSNGTKDYR
jgi:nucleolar GTP-binding protein